MSVQYPLFCQKVFSMWKYTQVHTQCKYNCLFSSLLALNFTAHPNMDGLRPCGIHFLKYFAFDFVFNLISLWPDDLHSFKETYRQELTGV